MNNKPDILRKNDIVWVRFNPIIGQSQYGDLCYIKAYCPNFLSVEKNKNQLFIKARISDLFYAYGKIRFILNIFAKDDTLYSHKVIIDDADRLYSKI